MQVNCHNELYNYSTKYAFVDQVVSGMTKTTGLHASPYEVAVLMEEEQNIYDTPCDDDEDYGPIYCEPPTEEEKLYAVFEGKRLQKLCHEDIRYAKPQILAMYLVGNIL